MGGWAPNNTYSLLGGLRSAAQMVSYEVPMVLSLVAIVLLTAMGPGEARMDLQGIVAAQEGRFGLGWFLFRLPVGPIAFLIFLITAIAESNRTPFDLPEAESELVSGFHTEYSGMKFAFFFLGEFAYMFAASAIAATLFLGGWLGPGPAWLGLFWFLLKSYLVVLLLMWLRWTLPRLRVDQLTTLSWKVLLPTALAVVVVAAGMSLQ